MTPRRPARIGEISETPNQMPFKNDPAEALRPDGTHPGNDFPLGTKHTRNNSKRSTQKYRPTHALGEPVLLDMSLLQNEYNAANRGPIGSPAWLNRTDSRRSRVFRRPSDRQVSGDDSASRYRLPAKPPGSTRAGGGYIELFYNPKRKHTNNGMLSTVDFEIRQLNLIKAGV